MNPVAAYIILLVTGEVIVHFVFYVISKSIGKPSRDRINFATILKGLLERTFVVLVLVLELPSALTVLGALKIATRIKDEESKVSNDFFLMGNLISIIFGIVYYLLYLEFIIKS
jgi:energy-converting hydrogenase Eha subunit B